MCPLEEPGGRVSVFHNKKFEKNTFVQEKKITNILEVLKNSLLVARGVGLGEKVKGLRSAN